MSATAIAEPTTPKRVRKPRQTFASLANLLVLVNQINVFRHYDAADLKALGCPPGRTNDLTATGPVSGLNVLDAIATDLGIDTSSMRRVGGVAYRQCVYVRAITKNME
jgi:hypothetical protein